MDKTGGFYPFDPGSSPGGGTTIKRSVSEPTSQILVSLYNAAQTTLEQSRSDCSKVVRAVCNNSARVERVTPPGTARYHYLHTWWWA